MEKSNMKNIVVLKNLPSNLVEEAIVILKSHKEAKQLELLDRSSKVQKNKKNGRNKDYIIKEAESVVSSYISKIEKEDIRNKKNINLKKYNKLKKYSIFVSILLFISLILNFIN